MRVFSMAVTLFTLTAAPLFAQTERGYLISGGGFAITPETKSGDFMAEVGVRIAPHLLVFGDAGQFHNLQPSDAQPAVDSTTATLSGSVGLNVVGTARVPAWYSVGGLRYEVPMRGRVSPYVLGGVGFARLTPTAQFTFSSGTLPDGSTPAVGSDVTNQLTLAGDFSAPPPSTALIYSLGGGLGVPLARHWTVDAGYRYSRVMADTALNAQGATFAFGYRF